MKRLVVMLLAALSGFAGVACEPDPDRVTVSGDSLVWQAAAYDPQAFGDAVVYAYGGLRAVDLYPTVHQDAQDPARVPDVLVMAFGQNYYPQIQPTDVESLNAFAALAGGDGCLVIVIPGYVGDDPNRLRLMVDYRAWAVSWYDAHSATTALADWGGLLADNPQYAIEDGFHLTPVGSAVYAQLINTAVEGCEPAL